MSPWAHNFRSIWLHMTPICQSGTFVVCARGWAGLWLISGNTPTKIAQWPLANCLRQTRIDSLTNKPKMSPCKYKFRTNFLPRFWRSLEKLEIDCSFSPRQKHTYPQTVREKTTKWGWRCCMCARKCASAFLLLLFFCAAMRWKRLFVASDSRWASRHVAEDFPPNNQYLLSETQTHA